jgi:type I restriction enzyme S subunit
MRLARITVDRCDGPFGSGLKSEHYTDEGIRVVRLQNIRHARFDDSDKAYISPEYYRKLGDHDVRTGDLLIAGLGDENNSVGRACVAPSTIVPAMVKADCFRFRLQTSLANPYFVAHQLSSTAKDLAGAFSSGTTRMRMNLTMTSFREMVLPPREEQNLIVEMVNAHTLKLDGLVSTINTAIARLLEYRTALISAAVTGKIDVRGEVDG